MRAGKLNSKPRTPCQVAVSSSHAEWFLLNVSSDLRMQIVGVAELDSRGQFRDLKAVSERSLPLATSAQSAGKLVCQTISLGGVLPACGRKTGGGRET